MTKKEKYIEYLKELEEFASKADINSDNLKILREVVAEQELVIPVVGEFSAGKSTLLNSFMGNDLLSVDVTPETAIASELHYSEEEKIEAVKKDGFDTYKLDELNSIDVSKYRYLKIFINNNELKKIAPLVLVDMPGFSSPLDAHNKAILNFLEKGVHYIVLISVEKGTMTASMKRQLSEIQSFNRDMTFFLSKVNLKPDVEVKEVTEKLKSDIDIELDLDKEIYHIGKDDPQVLDSVVSAINIDNLYDNVFLDKIKDETYNILESLNLKISSLKNSKEASEKVIEELENSIENIEKKRDEILEEYKNKDFRKEASEITNSVGSAINRNIDSLVNIALKDDEEALNKEMSDIIRHEVVLKVGKITDDINISINDKFSSNFNELDKIMAKIDVSDFSKKIQEKGLKLYDKTSSYLNDSISKRKINAKKTAVSVAYKTGTVLLSAFTSVVIPIVEMAIIFLPDIISFVTKKIRENKMKENIKNQLVSIIPKIKRDLERPIIENLKEITDEMINNISNEYDLILNEKKLEMEKSKSLIDSVKDKEEKIEEYKVIKNSIEDIQNSYLY